MREEASIGLALNTYAVCNITTAPDECALLSREPIEIPPGLLGVPQKYIPLEWELSNMDENWINRWLSNSFNQLLKKPRILREIDKVELLPWHFGFIER